VTDRIRDGPLGVESRRTVDHLIPERARLTIRVLGLNATGRCKERQRLLRTLDMYWTTGAWDDLREALDHGVYRFVTASFIKSRPRKRPGPLV
jgi:hypothetical protein